MKLCLKYFGKQNYPKSRVQLVVTVPVGESRPFEEAQDFVKKYGSEYYSAMVQIDDFSVKRGLGGKRGRGVGERGAGEVLEGGVRRCEENEECEVFFLVYTHVLLREIDTVRSVLLANRTLVAPLVKDRYLKKHKLTQTSTYLPKYKLEIYLSQKNPFFFLSSQPTPFSLQNQHLQQLLARPHC